MEVVYTLKKKKKLSGKNKRRITLAVVLLFFIAIFLYYFYIICPIVTNLSEEKIRSISTSAISEVVGDVMGSGGISYGDIVNITYSSSGKVEVVELDTVVVNNLIRQITKLVQDKFDALGAEGIKIALGTFTGIPFLYGIGPMVSVKLVPVGTVSTKLYSNFSSAGINQTLHRVQFHISANMGMVLPAQTKNFVTELEILLCENLIVGEIPEIYLSRIT